MLSAERIRNWTRLILPALLPQNCLLCQSGSATDLLCDACEQELPRLPEPHCQICALPLKSGDRCGQCLKSPPAYDATVALWSYDFPLDKLIQKFKFSHCLAVAPWLAGNMLSAWQADKNRQPADVLLPVPIARKRLYERGFNQTLEMSRLLANELNIPLSVHDCQRRPHGTAQSHLPWAERRRNMRNAFECHTNFDGKCIVVVDDVMTTGETLNSLAGILKKQGAVRVINLVAARTLPVR